MLYSTGSGYRSSTLKAVVHILVNMTFKRSDNQWISTFNPLVLVFNITIIYLGLSFKNIMEVLDQIPALLHTTWETRA